MWPSLKNLFVAGGLLALAACGSFPSVSTEVDYCCRPVAERVRTFRVEFEDMPEFLKPMLRDEASKALAAKGVDYTEGNADAILRLMFIGTPLESSHSVAGKPASSASPGGRRYKAEVRAVMTNSVTSELILSGSLYRIHDGTRGSYMHDAPARKAIREAFSALFTDFSDAVFEEK